VNSDEDPTADEERRPPEDRIYNGDMVLLVLFIAIAAVFALLLFVNRQMDQAMGDAARGMLTNA